ncbi:MAG: carboxymuconolactone decarboxylase family protein [Candidatus Binataceae bacterium]
MPNLEPLRREQVPELEPVLQAMQAALGFVPNSLLTLARRPEIVKAVVALTDAVLGGGTLAPQLKQMVGFIASTAAGCRYCQAHTAGLAEHAGVDSAKLAAAWDFETDPHFSGAEKAALRLARDASVVPNAATPEHFRELRKFFAEDEVVEIVAVIALFGWFNRWNDTMATQLEDEALQFASRELSPRGWTPGKHASTSK